MPDSRRATALLVVTLAASAGASTCALAPAVAANPAEELALRALGFELFLALFAFAGASLGAAPLAETLGLRRSRLPAGALALLVLGTVALSFALDGVIQALGLSEHGALAEIETALSGIRGRSLGLALLAFGLAPGIAEELLCRGLVQRALARRLGGPAAVTLAALVFGALHVDPLHAGFAALLGLYLGCVGQIAGSVRAAIGCHTANNLCAVLLSSFGPDLGPPPLIAIGLGGGCAFAALGWVARRAPRVVSLEDSRAAASADASPDRRSDPGAPT